MNEPNFEAIKAEILKRAKEAHACSEQYGRAYKSQTLRELCNVVKGNFNWAFKNKVITAELLMQFREDFVANEIYVNVSVQSGYLLCDSVTVEAFGNATVVAYGNVTVKACCSVTVEAYDSVTVEAYDNAYCTSYSAIECKLSGNAIYRLRSTNTVYFASDEIKFNKQTI